MDGSGAFMRAQTPCPAISPAKLRQFTAGIASPLRILPRPEDSSYTEKWHKQCSWTMLFHI